MNKWMKVTFILSTVFALLIAGCGTQIGSETTGDSTAESGEAKGMITFGVTPWTSTIPPTYVAKQILEDMGYTVELQEGDAGVVYTALSRGDVDVFMDAWLPIMHKNYMDRYGDTLVDTAVSYLEGDLGWVVTADAGIDSFEDLKGNEDLFDGKIYGIEEGAGMTITSREMIEAYDLDLEYVASSETGMLSQAKRNIEQGKPVLFLGWRPHPMFVNWDLKVLSDPQGFFERSEVHVITNKDLQENAPEAFEFLRNWSIPVGDIEEMIIKIDDGMTPEDAAKEWIEKNQDKVNQMLNQ